MHRLMRPYKTKLIHALWARRKQKDATDDNKEATAARSKKAKARGASLRVVHRAVSEVCGHAQHRPLPWLEVHIYI